MVYIYIYLHFNAVLLDRPVTAPCHCGDRQEAVAGAGRKVPGRGVRDRRPRQCGGGAGRGHLV